MKIGKRETSKLNHYAQDMEQGLKIPFPLQDERLGFNRQEKKATERKSKA